jgi:hypothetical protein
MENDCEKFYCLLQLEISDCERSHLSCTKKIECCFKVALNAWMELSQSLRAHKFTSEEKEIQFFKTLKPKFTSEIEYYTLVYHSLLFRPAEPSSLLHFWGREYGRLRRFRAENKDFIQCYSNHQSKQAPYFFLRKHYNLKPVQFTRLYDSDASISANGDWLVATLLALEKYRHYAMKQLERL